ncbi:tumor necrosis factor receptor superfamily member 16-like [Ptychodera flava]|uniref:tumor necrosis factor receptor superfamily member 16-like n=1 Tax=Ptychodera flava TaxID=63121 RepID=UPI00396A679B
MTYPPAIKVYQGFLLSLLLAGIFTKIQSVTTPQRCSDDGDYKQYWDEVGGTCKHCNKCNAGFGLNKLCGDGEGKGTICVDCPASYFSDDWNHDVCKKCRICENVESVYKECTAKHDRECGKCKDGFYKHIHGTCEPCEQEPERPECNGIPVTEPTMNITIPKPKRIPLIVNEQGTNEDQSGDSTGGLLVAAIVLPIIATILIIILLLIVIYMSRRKKKQPRANKGRQGRKDGRKRIGSDGGPNEAYQSTPEMQRHTLNTDPEVTQLIQRSVEW